VTFVAGLVAGIIITALGGLFVFQARVIEGSGRARRPDLRNLIAVAALIIAIVALARSGDHDATTTSDVTVPTLEPPTSVPTTTSSAPGSSSSTTSTTSSTSTTDLRPVTVPNVVGLEQTAAIAALQRAGLRSRVQSLALGNVPAGFVVTQTPIAYSTTTSGSIVLLGVSAGA
jgi:cytoskeletal protein RodZ